MMCQHNNEIWQTIYEPQDTTNKMTCAPSEDSHQPGHPPSLIRVDKKAMIRNGYNPVPHPALNTKRERNTYN